MNFFIIMVSVYGNLCHFVCLRLSRRLLDFCRLISGSVNDTKSLLNTDGCVS